MELHLDWAAAYLAALMNALEKKHIFCGIKDGLIL